MQWESGVDLSSAVRNDAMYFAFVCWQIEIKNANQLSWPINYLSSAVGNHAGFSLVSKRQPQAWTERNGRERTNLLQHGKLFCNNPFHWQINGRWEEAIQFQIVSPIWWKQFSSKPIHALRWSHILPSSVLSSVQPMYKPQWERWRESIRWTFDIVINPNQSNSCNLIAI